MEGSQLWTEFEVETLWETAAVLGVKKIDPCNPLQLEPGVTYLQWLKVAHI